MHTIGFAGTAKNTGKTTSALHVLDLCRKGGILPALTSIGYDGENLDTITGLPKPRYHLQAGELVATATGCLEAGSSRLIPIQATRILTALGEVTIARVEQAGTVLLAGPNRKADLLPVLEMFKQMGADAAFIDGALNRCVPLSAASAILFATGAALDRSIPFLSEHAAALADLFSIPAASELAIPLPGPSTVTIERKDGAVAQTGSGSVLNALAAQAVASLIPKNCRMIAIPGACQPEYLQMILERAGQHMQDANLLLSGPLKLLAGASPVAWKPVLATAVDAGCQLYALEPACMRLLTVNPFYPAYSPKDKEYTPTYVDAAGLRQAVAGAVRDVPVVDVCQPHGEDLLNLLGFQGKTIQNHI